MSLPAGQAGRRRLIQSALDLIAPPANSGIGQSFKSGFRVEADVR